MVSEHSWTPSARPSPIPTPDIGLQKLDPGHLAHSWADAEQLRHAFNPLKCHPVHPSEPSPAHSPVSRKEYAENRRHSDEDDMDKGGNHSTLQVPIHRRIRSGGERSQNWYETRQPRKKTLSELAQDPDPFRAITGGEDNPAERYYADPQGWVDGHEEYDRLSGPSGQSSTRHSRNTSGNIPSAPPSTHRSRNPSQNLGIRAEEPQREEPMDYQQPETDSHRRHRQKIDKARRKFDHEGESGCCC